ncbi:MAG TPA: MarC family protein [Aestuariivirga sp.]|nr:MarC family protein [Aestuariivirga sp.]
MTDYLSSAFTTLLVITDPLFLSAVFLGLTQSMTDAQRADVARRAAFNAFVLFVAAGLIGAQLLHYLGISLPAFRIAGGLLLLSSAAEMVFDRRGQRKEDMADRAVNLDHVKNIAAFPLAIPLIAGPGALTAIILLAGKAEGDVTRLGALLGVVVAVVFLCWLAMRLATRVSGLLGVTGRVVVTRLLGIILAALAVQFIIDGLRLALARNAL